MPYFDAIIIALCLGTLLGILRFALLAFWPEHPLAQVFLRTSR